jgi:hypothetical protein
VLFMVGAGVAKLSRGIGLVVASDDWRPAYGMMALAFVAIAAGWHRARGHALIEVKEPVVYRLGRGLGLRRRLTAWSFFAFIYVGVEASIGQWAYSQLPGAARVASPGVGADVAAFWFSLMAGRLFLGLSGRWFDPVERRRWALDLGVAGALVGAVAFCIHPGGWTTLAGLSIIGLSLSIVLPIQFKMTPDRVRQRIPVWASAFEPTCAGVSHWQSIGGTIGYALVPAAVGVWLQWHGRLALQPLILMLATLMLASHMVQRCLDPRGSGPSRRQGRPFAGPLASPNDSPHVPFTAPRSQQHHDGDGGRGLPGISSSRT